MNWVKRIAWLFVAGSVVVALFGAFPSDVNQWYPWLSAQSAKAKAWITENVNDVPLDKLPKPESIIPSGPAVEAPAGSSAG